MKAAWIVLVMMLLVVGCGTKEASPDPGTEGGPCYGNGTCNNGLTCASSLCVWIPSADAAADAMAPNVADTQVDGAADLCGMPSGVVRDFTIRHPDFGSFGSRLSISGLVITGLVAEVLDLDEKPSLVSIGKPAVVTNALTFQQWFRDVPEVNKAFNIALPGKRRADGQYMYGALTFFPLDGQGYGNEFDAHNYNFTVEVHARMQYLGGEIITVHSDDDAWLFINGRLVLDLGGVHALASKTISVDSLGLAAGEIYALDVFHAERQLGESAFVIESSRCLASPAN